MRLEIPRWRDYAERNERGSLYLSDDADVPEEIREEYLEDLEDERQGWEV